MARAQAREVTTRFQLIRQMATDVASLGIATKDPDLGLDLTRESLLGLLASRLLAQESLLAVGMVWEPDAVDGMDEAYADTDGCDENGLFVPCWTRPDVGRELSIKTAPANWKGLADRLRTDGNRAFAIGAPYTYESATKPRFALDIAVPIHAPSEEDPNETAFFGAGIVTWNLDELTSFCADLADTFDGYSFVLSPTGECIANDQAFASDKSAASLLDSIDESGSTRLEDGRMLAQTHPTTFGVEQEWRVGLAVASASLTANATWLTLQNILIGVVCAIAVSIGLWFATGNIVRPIQASVRGLQAIAEGEGDLTLRLDESRQDELGDLARQFNRFAERMQSILLDIRKTAGDLSMNATTVGTTSSELDESANRTSEQTSDVAEAARELSSGMQSADSATTTANEAIQAITTTMTQLVGGIGTITERADTSATVAAQARDLADRTTTDVQELEAAVREVGGVLETIREIADQTNLLALNATIEAARAGDLGKGFAVVAGEVKGLAHQTGEATHDIDARIQRITCSSRSAAQSIARIVDVITELSNASVHIANAVREQSEHIETMDSRLDLTAAQVSSVADTVQQSNRRTNSIQRSIDNVRELAQKSASGANETNAAGNELNSIAERLGQLVGQFRLES